MNRNFCHCQPIEKCPAECVETEISKTQHQAIKRKCWLLTQRHRFLDDSWSDQLPPLICRRIPFRSVKWTTNRWTEEKGVPFGIGRPEIEKQNKTKQPKKNITNGLTCRIDPMTERLSRPPRCVSKSRSCGNRLRATSGGFGRDLPPVVKSDAIQSNGESLGNAETKLPACRGRSSVFSVVCPLNTEFPPPGPTGNFYQSRYFNPNQKVFWKVFHKDFLFHIHLRLIIMTHNKFFGTFVR